MPHLGLQRIMIPSAQVSSLTTGSITLPSARGAFSTYAGPEGAYDALATINLSSAVSSVTFSGLPTGYKHLQIRMNLLGSTSTGYDVIMRFNGDSTTNYNWHRTFGNGSTVSSGNSTSSNIYIAGDGARDTYPVASVVDILDYASILKTKTTKVFTGFEQNGGGVVTLWGGLWRSTSFINKIEISVVSGNLDTNSHFALYGVK